MKSSWAPRLCGSPLSARCSEHLARCNGHLLDQGEVQAGHLHVSVVSPPSARCNEHMARCNEHCLIEVKLGTSMSRRFPLPGAMNTSPGAMSPCLIKVESRWAPHLSGFPTLQASLSSTFFQTLPEQVMPLKGNSLSLCTAVNQRNQHPPKDLGVNKTVEATLRPKHEIHPPWVKKEEEEVPFRFK